ncbi:hypothetical protein EGJ86_22285 [Pseudomonas sp. o96-267]|uniref:hypothetical protein n=1 Tax=Pseudomonas sp. o96-267 TaxID=2479853 RepID=UPI000F77FF7F|nr:MULTISPECIES: hypothetical protein [Pseudomonas]MDH0960901.1 hypothetical protein [Pseudomonas chengduensis]RRV29970.1 hypothetical protein EGJ86_22285 [Pseudomonas sp. o96-267]
MRIIDRSLATIRKISLSEYESLRLFALGKASAPRELLLRIRKDGHWLACECCHPAPVMHVAMRDTGMLSLKNNPDAADHTAKCPFARSGGENKTSGGTVSHKAERFVDGGHITLHSEIQPTGKRNTRQISRSDVVPRVRPKPVLSLLLSLMEMAGLHRYCPSAPVRLSDQYAALRAAAARFTVTPGIPLQHILDTRISKSRLFAMAKLLRETEQFGSSRRYGLLLDVITKVGPRQLICDGVELDFFGNAELLHGRSTPLLTLATVTTQEYGSNYYQLGKAAFVPVLSQHNLFPVVDDADRANVENLFGLLRWMHEKKEIEVAAARGLFQAGSGYVVELRHGANLLTVDLDPSPLPDDAPSPAGFWSLARAGGIDALKKQLIIAILKGAST